MTPGIAHSEVVGGARAKPKKFHRFHIVYSFQLLKKMLVFCLVPLVQPLISLDLPSLLAALRQEVLLLAVLAAAALLLWLGAGWRLVPGGAGKTDTGHPAGKGKTGAAAAGSDGPSVPSGGPGKSGARTAVVLEIRTGVLLRRCRRLTVRQIAAAEQYRPPWLRLLGCTRVTLYLAKSASLPSVRLYLPKRAAAALAEILLPTRAGRSFYNPTGAERLSLVMLSADLITTAALLWLSARQTAELLGESLAGQLNTRTLANLIRLEHFAERFLPAGLAWLFTLFFVLSGLSLLLSLFRTARFHVSRSGGVILCRGGLFTLTERRLRASAVTVCDVRTTLAARLLRRYPVYLAAGSFDGGDIPVLVCKEGQEELLRALMPQFSLPGPVRKGLYANGRSLPAFLGPPGVLCGGCLVLLLVSVWRLPALTPLLGLLLLPCLGLLAAALEAFFTEDAELSAGRLLTVQYTRGFTRHRLCVFTPDLALSIRQTPFSELQGRCNLRLLLPFYKKVRVRSIEYYRAAGLRLDV